jgi:hypothetical protein
MTTTVQRTRSSIAITVILLAGCGLSLNALAASDKVIDCKNIVKTAESFDVPVQQLSISVVDHFPDPTTDTTESLDLASTDAQNLAPILRLTPRVASMLDRVFETDSTESSSSELSEATSPVADQLSERDEVAQKADADEELKLPNVQQRMFRNDI